MHYSYGLMVTVFSVWRYERLIRQDERVLKSGQLMFNMRVRGDGMLRSGVCGITGKRG